MTELLPAQYAEAARLERELGDPTSPESRFSFRGAVELDEEDAFPEDACRLLEDLRLHHFYVPASCGGRLRSVEELLLLYRLVARRDLTVAIGHGKTLLGAMAVWVRGDDRQKADVARMVLDGAQLALALTERAHGSDLVASDVVAKRSGDVLTLDGEKWLINNATRGRGLSVLANVEHEDGTRNLSMLFVDKTHVEPASAIVHLPKNRTHGIRGADISGVAFRGARVSADAIVGDEGAGLEIALKLLQVTRTTCSALSLGAGDTALRVALDFATARSLYGTTVDRLPYARHMLVASHVQQLICECVSFAAARTLHVLPEQMSVTSAIAKYFVPTTIEASVASLSVVLGARYYLRGGYRDGAFEKLVRDNALIGLFDGSKVVNLAALGAQLVGLSEQRSSTRGKFSASDEAALEALFDMRHPTPPLDLHRLELTNGDEDIVVRALAHAPARVARIADHGAGAAVLSAVRGAADALASELARFDKAVIAAADDPAYRRSAQVFAHAKQYCALYAASACLHHWIFNRERLSPEVARGEWLPLALAQLFAVAGDARAPQPHAAIFDGAEALMHSQHRSRALFSTLPVAVAWSPPEQP
jgi:alkylation response protein AidB-like acyl-CoA dehydrogenase